MQSQAFDFQNSPGNAPIVQELFYAPIHAKALDNHLMDERLTWTLTLLPQAIVVIPSAVAVLAISSLVLFKS